MDFNTYPGGKNGAGVYHKIINHMPPHTCYIEPFLGGGAIMRMKKPALASIAIDADTQVIDNARTWQIPNLELIHTDALKYLDALATITMPSDTLIYLDPPYPISSRSQQRPLYTYEMTDQQHIDLLQIIRRLTCMVIISSYASDLYLNTLHDWRHVTFNAVTRSGRTATEHLWLNFPEPFQLHDYRYLGDNYRERERIKRKQSRWINKLKSMPAQERYSMLAVLQLTSPPPAMHLVTSPDLTMLEMQDPHAIIDDAKGNAHA
jgi:DNA adenine methylase